MKKVLIGLILIFILLPFFVNATNYYVSPSGSDTNPGTLSQPFKTIEKARNTIRATGENRVTVFLRGGTYEISQTIQFDSRDSGTASAPNVYQAYNGENVRIVGGIKLNPSDFSLVTSSSTPNVWSRINTNARGHVMQIDLSAYTTNYGILEERQCFSVKDASALELFFNQEPMELARWPNKVENDDIDTSISSLTVTGSGISPDVTGVYDYAGEYNNMPYYKLQGRGWYIWEGNKNIYRISNALGGGSYRWQGTKHDPRGAYHPTSGNPTGNPLAIPEIPGFEIIASTSDNTHFTYFGTRPERWGNAEEIWVHGWFGRWWYDSHNKVSSINTNTKVITLESGPNYYGIKLGHPYYFENLLEEIDIPGEWYLNRNTGILYFWPPGDNINSEIYVSIMENALVHLDSVNYMTFKDITFEIGRSNLVYIEDGSHCRLKDCVIRNSGTNGVEIESGSNHGVERCEIYGTGRNGVTMEGGDRVTLTPANHYVRNSDIHNFGRWVWLYSDGVEIDRHSVGHEVSHNLIHDAPHFAIAYDGNDHIIEYNEIHNVLEWCQDSGAIYAWARDWGDRGTIIRYNFVHDIDSPFLGVNTNGIYLDGGTSGQKIFGNIFYNIEGFGIHHNGGRDVIMENNILAKCGYGLRASSRVHEYFCCNPNDPDYAKHNDLMYQINNLGIDYQSPPWSTAYPEFVPMPNDCSQLENSHWLYPEGNVFSRNLGWQSKYHWMYESNEGGTGTFNKYKEISGNIENQDPLFVDEANLNMNLRPNSPAYNIPGFEPIPFDEIGLLDKDSIIPGDINGDGIINIFDLTFVTSRFGTTPSDTNWDSRADLAAPFGIIDIFDVVFVASRMT
ncbi:right-handed parallel beta-helix repeat-containing protein [Candidatus Woesearchaeota archaeon]|nr:right-handed parallel beta-helix repeat-containing protein [Candidatus Woesearchaeota archaeon]